jgi:hypothetical protein
VSKYKSIYIETAFSLCLTRLADGLGGGLLPGLSRIHPKIGSPAGAKTPLDIVASRFVFYMINHLLENVKFNLVFDMNILAGSTIMIFDSRCQF